MFVSQYDDIVTSRLRLVAITPVMLRSERAVDGRLEELTGFAIPVNWPPEHWEPHVHEILLRQYERCPEQVAWQRHVGLLRDGARPLLIGSVGAFSHEETPDECEMGWSILPPYEGQGLATEAARGLIDVLRERTELRSVVAHTFPELIGSLRVMEKCGFRSDGPGKEARTLRYRLQLRE